MITEVSWLTGSKLVHSILSHSVKHMVLLACIESLWPCHTHLVTVNDGHNAKDKAAEEGGENGQHQVVLWLALGIDSNSWW